MHTKDTANRNYVDIFVSLSLSALQIETSKHLELIQNRKSLQIFVRLNGNQIGYNVNTTANNVNIAVEVANSLAL